MVVAWIIARIVSRKRDGGNNSMASRLDKAGAGRRFPNSLRGLRWQRSCRAGCVRGNPAMKRTTALGVLVRRSRSCSSTASVPGAFAQDPKGGGGGGGQGAARRCAGAVGAAAAATPAVPGAGVRVFGAGAVESRRFGRRLGWGGGGMSGGNSGMSAVPRGARQSSEGGRREPGGSRPACGRRGGWPGRPAGWQRVRALGRGRSDGRPFARRVRFVGRGIVGALVRPAERREPGHRHGRGQA